MVKKQLKKITIRKARVDDATAIRKLENYVWREDVVNKYDEPMYIQFGWCFVATADDKIIGAITSFATKDGGVFVCDWVVKEAYRSHSVGVRLYKRLIAATKDKKIVSYIDPNNHVSLAVHKKLGFDLQRRSHNPYGLEEGVDIGKRIFAQLKR